MLDGFERIDASPGTALLRVTARGGAGEAASGSPTLVIDDGVRLHRLTPLPAPPDAGDVIRAAFSAPISLLRNIVRASARSASRLANWAERLASLATADSSFCCVAECA